LKQYDLLKFKLCIRMGKKGDFSADLGFTENGQKKRKYTVSGSSLGKNALLMHEENDQTGSS